ncbi:DUF3530 family protein [Psychrobium sp. 1_MG-2023]|uniref:DUF3530 family protein n=1 Tax=Psychrobium sp. 1_MG-2023 TaxID=3062624 RepID=UPI000C333F13|nr:DUF3530 family protein [Psychrobium sp. 1_MG-2023]MDP2561287.1 DUF3530 family protein [Psychrobium sp. 1_MG-2023]PKF54104.1 hypothetical protein CW748_16730 [Alteromonadales bacterium alter-6D02]
MVISLGSNAMWKLSKFVAVCAMLTLSTCGFAQEEEQAQAKKSVSEQLLAQHFPPAEVKWFDSASGKFLVLQRDYMAATRHGVAIILSDMTTPLNNPELIENLRTGLTEKGWMTLSIMPPSAHLLNEVSPSSEETGANAAEAASDPQANSSETNNPYTLELISRLNSALNTAGQISKHSVLIIQGRQIAYLTKALSSKHLRPPSGIVILDAHVAFATLTNDELATTQQKLANQITKLNIPVLDVYQIERPTTLETMRQRKLFSNKNRHPDYRQTELVSSHNDELLVKTLYGWFRHLGLN